MKGCRHAEFIGAARPLVTVLMSCSAASLFGVVVSAFNPPARTGGLKSGSGSAMDFLRRQLSVVNCVLGAVIRSSHLVNSIDNSQMTNHRLYFVSRPFNSSCNSLPT